MPPAHDHDHGSHAGHKPHGADEAREHSLIPEHHLKTPSPLTNSWLIGWVISGIVLLIALLGAIVAYVLFRTGGVPPS
jgi:hypothetical protein